jgi:structural maintenance of chromosome 4
MMKPKAPNEHEDGMLEFLEDIIGSSRYQEPISVLAKRVEELNELRGEKVSSVHVLPIYFAPAETHSVTFRN